MSYSENTKPVQKEHELSLTSRTRLMLTGVTDVLGFDDNVVVLTTVMGELTVRGSALHVERIDLDVGHLELRGSIQELSYSDEQETPSLLRRIFG